MCRTDCSKLSQNTGQKMTSKNYITSHGLNSIENEYEEIA